MASESLWCCSCPPLALSLNDHLSADHSVLLPALNREQWLWVTDLCSSHSVLTWALGWREGREWLDEPLGQAEPTADQTSGWIMTLLSVSFQSLEKLCDISWRQTIAGCRLSTKELWSSSKLLHLWFWKANTRKNSVCGVSGGRFNQSDCLLILNGWHSWMGVSFVYIHCARVAFCLSDHCAVQMITRIDKFRYLC